MAVLKNKIPASTLIEVVVAMAIIMISFIAISMFINQFIKVNNSNTKVNAYLILEEEVLNTRKSLNHYDEVIDYGNLQLIRSIFPYKKNENLIIIHYQVLDFNKKLILERKEIVPKIK